MTETPELRPCPFCGGAPQYVKEIIAEAGTPLEMVSCTQCNAGVSGVSENGGGAVDMWNRRVAESQIVEGMMDLRERVRELEDAIKDAGLV